MLWHDLIGKLKTKGGSGQLTFALLEETLLSAKCYKTRRISSEDYETSRSLFRYIGRVNITIFTALQCTNEAVGKS
jgi:hypothetical protein